MFKKKIYKLAILFYFHKKAHLEQKRKNLTIF